MVTSAAALLEGGQAMRVTEPTQRAVTQAKREAGRLGHDRVGTEHLLLGLLGDQESLAVVILASLGTIG
jgi:ATP-dependent Clp protease ATP-binding subunit ClpA